MSELVRSVMLDDISKEEFQNRDSELIEMLRTIWGGRFYILLTVLLCVGGTIYYVYSLQEWWTSKAVITSPSFEQNSKMYKDISMISKSLDAKYDNAISTIISKKALMNIFVEQFNSFNNKNEFINNQKGLLSFSQETLTRKEIAAWASRINVEEVKIENVKRYQLTFQATTSELSEQLLSKYINFISELTINLVNNDILTLVSMNRDVIKNQIEILNIRAEALANKAKEQTKNALYMADYARITNPLENVKSNDFPFELGTQALKAKEDILSKINDLSYYQPELKVLHAKLNWLENFKSNNELFLFDYIKNPSKPFYRDKPNRLLFILVSLIVSLIIGISIAYIVKVLKQEES
ncbi:Wzz/FepE/Etk N-terminal domain-containing protein [Photobacterium leiognathi]|uniref:Wzz/FepE/Etk N-terminal domain-containing protein n=1 Tax=Photobacterium leiognathi TaxID=553611 RepID=UPI002980DAB9|nr:Wzz/FepE/Etk N-terminal domain-containing protein [Photobacterium leiognathi]